MHIVEGCSQMFQRPTSSSASWKGARRSVEKLCCSAVAACVKTTLVRFMALGSAYCKWRRESVTWQAAGSRLKIAIAWYWNFSKGWPNFGATLVCSWIDEKFDILSLSLSLSLSLQLQQSKRPYRIDGELVQLAITQSYNALSLWAALFMNRRLLCIHCTTEPQPHYFQWKTQKTKTPAIPSRAILNEKHTKKNEKPRYFSLKCSNLRQSFKERNSFLGSCGWQLCRSSQCSKRSEILITGCELCALHHGIQNSMEAILACHPALLTEWLSWVAVCVNYDVCAQAQLVSLLGEDLLHAQWSEFLTGVTASFVDA